MKLIFLIFFILVSCSSSNRIDVSNEEKFSKYVGKILELSEGKAIGVTDTLGNKTVDRVILTPLIGFSGPEVIFKKTTPSKMKVKIIKVLMIDFFIKKNYYFEVKILDKNFNQSYVYEMGFKVEKIDEISFLNSELKPKVPIKKVPIKIENLRGKSIIH